MALVSSITFVLAAPVDCFSSSLLHWLQCLSLSLAFLQPAPPQFHRAAAPLCLYLPHVPGVTCRSPPLVCEAQGVSENIK